MTKPYSIDLRERAVARVVAGESVRAVAAVLKISASSVVKWAQRERATGSVAPGQMGGHRPRVLVGDHRTWLLERAKSDFTLRGWLRSSLSGCDGGLPDGLEVCSRRTSQL
jgi:transposase